ncbi:fungal specific transcription factor domain-containing protein [Aspergillus thermomutatus]|uniref:Xylanolytic transcriptional activator regulatory domain-containing protein n=1 Tax=Aspergillus thermomutatus TaxID=41047 RepID=A0A397GGT9_ASPTH|nr:uncharacterized protein CDV56_103452 [Aspergillus thermomutatus]RHZ49044.1 hypothetical protein CDV56_103452 [Aspergillus thermomutatus]
MVRCVFRWVPMYEMSFDEKTMLCACCSPESVTSKSVSPVMLGGHYGLTDAVEIQVKSESEYLRGMAENSQVHLTRPLDNLVTELHDFLGLGHPSLSFVPVLPRFIRSMSEDIQEEDMEYLEFKGVFRVPDTILRHELLKAFVESVYPFLPVLDLESFLLPVISNDGVQTVSLLLFHAVMFSATAFVQLKHLHNAGYETRKEAREQFYLRARTFYDFDIEKDRVVLIQALLLMTYWHETPDNPKDSQYWLNVCWSLGASIGLDCDPSTSPMNPQLQKVWKRLWWCLYTRDTLLALNLRRPLCYGNDKNRLPLISLEEFNIGCHLPKIIMALGDCDFLQNVHLQRHLAVGFIEKAKLSTLISDILFFRDYQEKKWRQTSRDSCKDRWKEAFQGLEAWCKELPVELQYEPLRSEDLGHATKLLHVQRAWIRVIFLATIGTLHREAGSPRFQGLSLPRAQYGQVICEMSSILQDLNQLGLVQYLPTTTVALLVPVLARLVLDFKANTGCMGIETFERFYQGMQVLGTLGDVYSSAVTVRRFFEGTLHGGKQGSSYVSMPSAIRNLLTKKEQDAFATSELTGVRGNI